MPSPSPFYNHQSGYPHPGNGARSLVATGEGRLAYLRQVYALFFTGIVAAAGGAMTALYAGESSAPLVMGRRALTAVRVPPLVAFVAEHWILSIIVFFGAFFGANAVRHIRGVNVAALIGFTFFSGLYIAPILFIATLLGTSGQAMTANPVRDAFLIATAGFGGLSAYTLISRKDFSFLGGFLTMGIWVLIGASLIGMFMGGAVFQLAIASAGVLLFGGYVLYDTSRLLHSDEPLDPIRAALQLYLDFLNIFLFILRILMGSRRD